MDFKQKVEAFKDSCKMYQNEKIQAESVDEDEMLKEYLEEDISFVENTFGRLNELCGEEAVSVIWKLFVQERTQVDVAYELNMSRRQLQYLINQWLQKVFEDESD